MAILTMTQHALEAERVAVAARGVRAEGVAEPAAEVGQASRRPSTRWSPTFRLSSEVIGIYIAGVGIIGPASGRARWGLLLLSLALILLFIWLSNRIEKQSDPTAPNAFSKLAWVCLLATCAFLAWSAALPETSFLDFSANATRLGSFAAVVLAALMPKIAAAVGIVSRSS
jgi:hypothetical protein